ncbi:MAG: TIGR03032 family protein [Gemmataceae bacterium]
MIREAGDSDTGHIRSWLSEALGGSPPAKLLVAADAATFDVVGVAALRVFVDQVGRFLLYVEPASRRRGCGSALLDAVRDTATRAGVQALLTVRSYELTASDALTMSARAFLQARGLTVAQEIRRLRTDLTMALKVLEPIYQRFMRRSSGVQAATIVQAAQVDAQALAAFAVRHVGGIPEEVAQRLNGRGKNAYSPTLSWVALVDNQIVGALLSVPDQLLVETRVVDEKFRGSGLNLILMYRAAAAGAAAGYQTIEFEHDTRETDTSKLVGRLNATQIGCRQCFGVSLPAQAPEQGRQDPVIASPPAAAPNRPERLNPPARAAVESVRTAQQATGAGQARQELERRQLGAAPVPPRAAHTPNLPALLRQFGASLLIAAYQADNVVLIRDDGDHLNAHFRAFTNPTGLALAGDRLALGSGLQVHEFVNAPAMAARLEPPGKHDACFVPRSSHFTGDIKLRDMARDAAGELWIVNTRFSCLCTLDRSASFTPRWRPAFVSALDAADRCHLNGLAMVAGKPKYVTALGETDTPGGWRQNKASGGMVIDVASGAVLARGLSLPHSPRWHDDRLWLCESGTGTFGYLDSNTGKYQSIAETPGFTRGLDFAGPFAFVGVSKLRDSARAGGAAVAQRVAAQEQTCGVCVIDLRSGQVVALLRFDSGVQEIFAVAILGRRFPELVNVDAKLLENAFVVPGEPLVDVPSKLGDARSGQE